MYNKNIKEFWCSQCNDFHINMYWHEKYNNYMRNQKRRWSKIKKKRPELFQNVLLVEELYNKDLKEVFLQKECIICGTKTHFFNMSTGHYNCSNECKHADESLSNGKMLGYHNKIL